MTCAVAYLRVSTDRQGSSGLGIEAQRTAVRQWAEARGATVTKEFVETESGRNKDRPELARALAHAKRYGCTVAVAKLDRLARDARFVLETLDSGADIAFCDLPQMEGAQARLMLTQFAAFAEYEGKIIGQRTKAALAAAKARGVKLGNPDGAAPLVRYHAARRAAGAAHRGAQSAMERATRDSTEALAIIREIEAEGFTSQRQIAGELNRRHVRTPRGGTWHQTTVARLMSAARQPSIEKSAPWFEQGSSKPGGRWNK